MCNEKQFDEDLKNMLWAEYALQSRAKFLSLVTRTSSGAGNIFLYRPETGACEPLYYTTTDGLSTAGPERSHSRRT